MERATDRTTTVLLPVALAIMVLIGVTLAYDHLVLVFGVAMAVFAVGLTRAKAGNFFLQIGVLTVALSGIAVGPLTLPDLFLLPAAAALLFGGLLRKDVYVPPWLVWAGAIILVGGLLPFIFGLEVPPRGATVLLQFVVTLMAVPLVVSLGVRSVGDLRRLASWYVVSASISSLFAILHFVGVSNMASTLTGFQGFEYNRIRVSGLAAHPNQLGLTCALAMPIALHLLARSRAWGVCLVLLSGGVMVSGSRSGLLAFVIGVVLYLWMGGYLSTPTLVKGVAAVVLAVAAAKVVGLDVALRRLVGGSSVVEADRERLEGLRVGVDDVLKHPLTGVGFGKVPHNLYLEILQGAGLLALIGFGLFASGVLRTARVLRQNRLVRASAAAMGVWLIAGMLHPGLYDRYLYVPAGLVLGGLVLARRRRPSTSLVPPAVAAGAR